MKYLSILAFTFTFLLISCKIEPKQAKELAEEKFNTRSAEIIPIDEALGPLFKEVQLSQVFEDGKTFVDCVAKYEYDSIFAKYDRQKELPDFDLESFVYANFEVPSLISSDFKSDPNRTAAEHVAALWPVLTRPADSVKSGSTLIPLPHSYIVPGGRFREVYYWDSYFTMLGLMQSGEFELVAHILDNFAYLIETVGHIPNGNRSYYITRSQPPFFAQMVSLYAAEKGDQVYDAYKSPLRKEYEFWMKGALGDEKAVEHTVKLPFGVVNRYYDQGDSPRHESYREDYLQVQKMNGGEKMYRDLRSGAESGWDYSTRWFADGKSIETIETTNIIPVDLNALLYGLEEVLLKSYGSDAEFVKQMKASMVTRKQFLVDYSWNNTDGVYEDYNFVKSKRTGVKSLAMVYPLFFNMSTQVEADQVANYIETHFLKPGGLPATLNHSGQQWDAPNGWAPLQWMAVKGLENYGHTELAKTIAERWVELNEKVYKNTGKFVEKYNVEDMGLEAGGGEYPVQDGFGWSNGVYLAMKAYLNNK